MGKGRDAARSDTRTAKPASETTTLLPGEKRRRSRGTLHRNKLLENRKINFQESSQQANPARKNPARHRAGERQHPSGRRSRPNPRTGAKRQQGEKNKGQAPLLRRLEYHKHRTRQKRGQQCGTYIATEQNGLPKEGTKPLRGKAGPLVRAQL